MASAPAPSRAAVAAAAYGTLAAVVATIVRFALVPIFGSALPYATYFPAVALGAWAGGMVGGLTALALSTLASCYFFLEPVNSFTVARPEEVVVFLFGGGLIVVLGHELHRSRAAARAAERTAEARRNRAAFVADASALLGEHLDIDAAVEALTRLAVPRFADWCALDFFEPDGTFTHARIATTSPETEKLALELRARYPYSPDASMGVAAVMRTGQPEVVLDMPADFMDQIPDPWLRDTMKRLGIRSYVSVPISSPRRRRLGVMTVVMADSGRLFTVDDVETSVDLAWRLGAAIDNATLFDDVRRHRDELELVIQSIEDPVLVAGRDGVVAIQNRAATAALGDVRGSKLDEVTAALVHVSTSSTARRLGDNRYVEPLLFSADEAGSHVRVAMLRDVTALLESEAARDAFLGMLSHELRTPITTIFGSAQVLRRPLAEDARGALIDGLAIEADRLYRLVEDLLVLSRFERGRLSIAAEPVLMSRVVGSSLKRAMETYPAISVDMRLPSGLPPAMADETYIDQILRNLISNSVKYAGDAVHLTVRASAADDYVELEFEDDGPGIPDKEAERVFALYERLGNATLKPGAGVGLFVCRRLAEAMGGEIAVTRSSAGGALFKLRLPAVADEPLHPEHPREPEQPPDAVAAPPVTR